MNIKKNYSSLTKIGVLLPRNNKHIVIVSLCKTIKNSALCIYNCTCDSIISNNYVLESARANSMRTFMELSQTLQLQRIQVTRFLPSHQKRNLFDINYCPYTWYTHGFSVQVIYITSRFNKILNGHGSLVIST